MAEILIAALLWCGGDNFHCKLKITKCVTEKYNVGLSTIYTRQKKVIEECFKRE